MITAAHTLDEEPAAVIVDRQNRLLDCEAMALWLRRDKAMIRKRCTPVACDVASHNLLFHVDQATEKLAGVPRRKTEQQMAQPRGWLDPQPAPDPRKAGRRRR